VLDEIFKHYYKIFNFAFEECDPEFQREIIFNSRFEFFQNESEQEESDQM
jgi:hypothetical protein